jgi:hypothetical protein
MKAGPEILLRVPLLDEMEAMVFPFNMSILPFPCTIHMPTLPPFCYETEPKADNIALKFSAAPHVKPSNLSLSLCPEPVV